MKKSKLIIASVWLIFLVSTSIANAQDEPTKKTMFNSAKSYFNEKDFQEALKKFLVLDSLEYESFEVKYYIGACYLNTDFEKLKAIPYLEHTLQKKPSVLPPAIYNDLGDLYHQNYGFDKAIEYYNLYLKKTEKADIRIRHAEKMIEVCENAKKMVEDSVHAKIFPLPGNINSDDSEGFPVISTDESEIFFVRKSTRQNTDAISKEEIMKSVLSDNSWQPPKKLDINMGVSGNVSLAGISPDGQHLFVKVTKNENDDIYTGLLVGTKTEAIVPFNKKINSAYSELSISITADGQDIYFSSNRPGGYGGYDLYKILMDKNGDWGEPMNLGAVINTSDDEIAPFIHPDKQTLYFSSNAHNTIGGFDIYKSFFQLFENEWSPPDNLGYPINTTSDDIFFMLNAGGSHGYFSSAIHSRFGNHDIYRVDFYNSIPLTLVKGTILAGNPPKPVKTRIRVVDRSDGEQMKYVYNPNPETGKYLMIFPPGKNYDMIIEAEGYLPHRLNIHIPNQTYFYELFQVIHLQSVKSFGEVIGEEITITNNFFDVYNQTGMPDSLQRNYSELINLIDELIVTTDSLGLEYIHNLSFEVINKSGDADSIANNKNYDDLLELIENAIETTDTSTLRLLDENTIYSQKSNSLFFYGLRDENTDLVPYLFGKDTIYTIPPINFKNTSKESGIDLTNLIDLNKVDVAIISYLENKNNLTKESEGIDFSSIPDSRRKTILSYNIFFQTGSSVINQKYNNDIVQIENLLLDYKDLGVEIYGYADTQGKEDSNEDLSNQRATSVMQEFLNKGLSTRRSIVKGFGETKAILEKTEKDKQYNRRVEIKVFEIIPEN